MKRIAIFAALAAITMSNFAFAQERGQESEWVSIIHLIATPERFHEKKVFITAYVTVEFENMSICMTAQAVSSKDCLWLDINSETSPSDNDSEHWRQTNNAWMLVNQQAVSIHGTFDKNSTGHFGGWSGAIKDVTRVYAKDLFIDFTTHPPIVRKRLPESKAR